MRSMGAWPRGCKQLGKRRQRKQQLRRLQARRSHESIALGTGASGMGNFSDQEAKNRLQRAPSNPPYKELNAEPILEKA